MSTEIVILCPHNAAKSVYSAAILQGKASEKGLDVSVTTGGTDPDKVILPIVRVRLETLGHEIPVASPKIISDVELTAADKIINIGCDRDRLPTEKPIIDWSIPNFSDDHEAAFAALDQHVEQLLTELTSL